MDFVFIVNPISGEIDKGSFIKRMESAFRLSEHNFIKIITECRGDAERHAREYAMQHSDGGVVVACGGDGTIHEVANGIAGTKTAMLALPLGTGNDFCKKIYGTRQPDLEVIMKRFGLLDGKVDFDVKPIDLIDVNGKKCINVMSFGFDTKVETLGRKMAAKFKAIKKQAYNIAVPICLAQGLKYKMNVDIDALTYDGEEVNFKGELDYTLLAVCNASYYGGSFCPAKDAELDDGWLDLCIAQAFTVGKALPIIPQYAKGVAHEKSDNVKLYKVKGGTVSTTDGTALLGNCDGENFDYSTVHFNVEPKALRLCVTK